jgi:hypothetical protein
MDWFKRYEIRGSDIITGDRQIGIMNITIYFLTKQRKYVGNKSACYEIIRSHAYYVVLA